MAYRLLRKRILSIVGVFAVSNTMLAGTIPVDLIGRWHIVSVYKTSNVQGLSYADQKKLLGSTLTIGHGLLSSCGGTVKIESVDISRIGSDDLLMLAHITFKSLRIKKASILRIVINEDESGNCFGTHTLPGEDVYLKSHDEICVNLNDVLFKAVRVGNTKP